MEMPLELIFRGVKKTPDLEEDIRRRAERLNRFHSGIIGCHIAVEKPHENTTGNPYRVRINLTVPPGNDVVVDKEPGQHDKDAELQTVITDAFHAAERQLKDLKDRQSGEVKAHDVPHAFVVRLFRDEGYGFIKTEDDREIYFHQNSVVDRHEWEQMTVGTQVRFAESMGEMGPQASTVHIIDKPGVRTEAEE